MQLGKRKELILTSIIEQYVKTGEPVGSKLLMTSLPISVSSATIRNEMNELWQMGLLDQPHTSAGRIPSQAGYRYYIDNLMDKLEPSETEKHKLKYELERFSTDPDKLLEKAGEMLARITDCAALATTPADSAATIRRIEIVPIASRLALIVLMTSTGIVKNGICRTDIDITGDMLDTFRRVCDDLFVNKPVTDIGTVMIQTLVASLGANALVMSPMFVSLADIADQAVRTQVHLEGEQNLLHHRELTGTAFEMMQFLDQSEKLERAVSAHKEILSVHIGSENMFKQLANSSMIISRYSICGHDGGAIGIIGPTRMNYAKLIPSIEYLTDLVSGFLTDAMTNSE